MPPLLEYGHIIFQNLKNPARNNLKVAETSAIRKITKLRHPQNPLHNPPNEQLYQITNIPKIEERLRHLSTKFSQRQSNIDCISKYCLQRNPSTRVRISHPIKTIWEHIQSQG